jgi:hypothetical protein
MGYRVRRTACSACGSSELDQFLDLGSSPIADAYTATADEASPTYPLQVAVCAKCRLVQLLEVVPADELFGTGYSFYSSASPPLSAYHTDYARDVLGRYPEAVKRGVVEIGCNDGDMLRHFAHFPHEGIDPSAGPAAEAMRRGLNVTPFAFSFERSRKMGTAGVVIANHVLAHVENVSDMLAGIAHLMDADSIAMIEVQYLPDLLVNNAFDLVYHEHRNYFSLASLEQAAMRHDLNIVEVELTDRQGGSLRATLSRRRELPGAGRIEVDALRTSERWLSLLGAYEGMQGRAERIRARLLDLLADQAGETALYGAPAKATTLLNFCELTKTDLPYCWDTTAAKQGRYIPGTGIEIVAPWGQSGPGRPRTFLLAAWNYAQAIMHSNPGFRWIVPLPAPWLIP